MQIHLWNEHWDAEPIRAIAIAVGVEELALNLVASEAALEALVQCQACGPIVLSLKLLTVAPPVDEGLERETVGWDLPVKDKAMFRILGDLDVVADGISKHKFRFGSIRGKDQVLDGASYTATLLVSPKHLDEPCVVVELGDNAPGQPR